MNDITKEKLTKAITQPEGDLIPHNSLTLALAEIVEFQIIPVHRKIVLSSEAFLDWQAEKTDSPLIQSDIDIDNYRSILRALDDGELLFAIECAENNVELMTNICTTASHDDPKDHYIQAGFIAFETLRLLNDARDMLNVNAFSQITAVPRYA